MPDRFRNFAGIALNHRRIVQADAAMTRFK